MINGNSLASGFFWLNEPRFSIADGRLHITTSPNTDFWQRTHYGFRRDNGHCLLTTVDYDFALSVRSEFHPQNQYDQCGLIVRLDAENWIKVSTEYEAEGHSRLGSVVTNLGFSDWATIDLYTPVHTLWYRVRSKNQKKDLLLEYSQDGAAWSQLRITHLHAEAPRLQAGVYACSPTDGSFSLTFDSFSLGPSTWD